MSLFVQASHCSDLAPIIAHEDGPATGLQRGKSADISTSGVDATQENIWANEAIFLRVHSCHKRQAHLAAPPKRCSPKLPSALPSCTPDAFAPILHPPRKAAPTRSLDRRMVLFHFPLSFVLPRGAPAVPSSRSACIHMRSMQFVR